MAAAFTPPASARTGDGRCERAEVCVYNSFNQKASKGYFDLKGGHKNFHGNQRRLRGLDHLPGREFPTE
jgi:hypothetical protein